MYRLATSSFRQMCGLSSILQPEHRTSYRPFGRIEVINSCPAMGRQGYQVLGAGSPLVGARSSLRDSRIIAVTVRAMTRGQT
jgi:hypothetical protein